MEHLFEIETLVQDTAGCIDCHGSCTKSCAGACYGSGHRRYMPDCEIDD